ncbi:hypothetical protein HMPREF1142_1686 [Peptostreptococcaceae bacterium AS15]|nr:hypothetical protein HMPREF1142_1686 [Peptostreptococcaceae bacterium AS15]
MTLHLKSDNIITQDETSTVTLNYKILEEIIMTNKEKALALINTFASGDTAKAK